MKPLVIKQNSWHYWFAKNFSNLDPYRLPPDICSYTRLLLKGIPAFLLIALFGIAGSSMILYIVADTLAYLAFVLVNHYFPEPGFGPLFMGLLVSVVGTVSVIVWIGATIRNKYKAYRAAANLKNIDKPDTFVSKAFSSWKEKTCIRLQFTKSNGEPFDPYKDY